MEGDVTSGEAVAWPGSLTIMLLVVLLHALKVLRTTLLHGAGASGVSSEDAVLVENVAIVSLWVPAIATCH